VFLIELSKSKKIVVYSQLPTKILPKNFFYIAGGAERVQSQLSKFVSEEAQRPAPSVFKLDCS